MTDNSTSTSEVAQQLLQYIHHDDEDKKVEPWDRVMSDLAGKPFDGSNVLVHVKGKGWCEAHWIPATTNYSPDGPEYVEGFEWCCLNDTFSAELDEVDFWMPLPEIVTDASYR